MSNIDRDLQNAFNRYFDQQITRAKAITPGQKKELIEQLRQELSSEGRIPLPTGPVKVDPNHPIVRAALDGRPVTMGGKVIKKKKADTVSERLQELPTPAKIGLMVMIFLLPLIIIGSLIFMGGEDSVVVELPTALPTSTPTAVATITPTAEPDDTPVPTATNVEPTAIVVVVTPTPYAFTLTSGSAPDDNNDPASIEMAGFSYILGVGKVQNGVWQPNGAEWLANSELRRVIALPYEANLANAVNQVRAGNVIKLRLRSGEIVKYKISERLRVQRQQIEVLSAREPSLAIILYGEASPERSVVLANAVQEPQEFSIYSARDESANWPTPAVPTLIPTSEQTIITSTLSVTNTLAGLSLTVGECNEVERIAEQTPSDRKDRFYVCDLTLTALPLSKGSFYSDEAIGITEQKEIDNSVDWFPPLVPGVTNALGTGTLNAGQSISGRVAGLVKKGSSMGMDSSDPVLLWKQAGIRYIIKLQP